MNIYSNNTWKTVVGMLKSDEHTGLSEFECEERRKNQGGNKVFVPYKRNALHIIKVFFSFHIFFSLVLGIFFMYVKEYILGSITLAMLLATIVLKAVHSRNIAKRVKFMERLNNSTARVLRNSLEKIVKAEEIVKGDIVLFSKDSLISADIRIIECEDLKVDEKNVTGEKFLKDKFDSKIDSPVYSVEEMKNMVFKGSVVRSGSGYGVVVETGNATHLGKTLILMASANNNKHTLSKRLEKKYSALMFASIIISVLSFLVSMNFVDGYKNLYLSLFLTQVIPVVIITFLFISLIRKELKRRGIDLVNLSTLDMISDINILFMDKIGSITKEEMVVDKIYVNNKLYSQNELAYSREVTSRRLIEGIVLCNNAEFNRDTGKSKGDLIEAAYLKYADNKGITKAEIESANRRIFEIPMDSDKRMITTINKAKRGCRANCKGNVDAVLSRCKYIMVDGLQKEMTSEEVGRLKAIDYNLSLEGYITQAVAYRNFSYTPSIEENIENNLVFTGIVALDNPLSDELNEEIEAVKSRGIIPIVFTDDNKITATTIGRKARLVSSNSRVIAGVELYSLGQEELLDTVSRTRVFSRVNPELKARIIGLFVKDNYKVAACGECLGDLPSICISKLGISKGKAPEIIKNASDIFMSNNFLKGFLKIFDLAEKFNDGINKYRSFILGLMISQILALNIIPIFNEKFSLSVMPIFILNMILAVPLSLLVLHSSKNSADKYVSRIILYVALSLGALYDVESGHDIIWLFLFGVYFIGYCLVNCKISFKRISAETMALLSAIVILGGAVGILFSINSYEFSQFTLLKVAAIAVGDLICELILKKWQE